MIIDGLPIYKLHPYEEKVFWCEFILSGKDPPCEGGICDFDYRSSPQNTYSACIAQLIERLFCNQDVGGLNPSMSTKLYSIGLSV